ARGFKEQRDAAIRRADGLEARLGVEERRTAELAEELERLRREGEELRRGLEAAAEDREQALERLRRRHEADRAADREELRELRRELQREQRRDPREGRADERLQEQVREEVAAYEAERRRASAGRASTLPPGTAPDTKEAVHSHLEPGRRVLVDGYNVTKQHRGHLDLEQQRLWLVRLLEALAARTGVTPTVVFDAQEGSGATGSTSRRVRTVFSEGTADDHLVEMVAALDEDEPVLVVTDDRELTDRLRALRADVVPTRTFLDVAE
ncbi:MAG: NYN domain-containing protein, partial [Nitriliruptorales bacterium]